VVDIKLNGYDSVIGTFFTLK